MNTKNLKKTLEEYLLEKELKGLSPNTLQTYTNIIHTYLEWLNNQPNTPLEQTIKQYLIHQKKEKHLSQDYIALTTRILKNYLEYMNIDTHTIITPKKTRKLPKTLTTIEAQQIMEYTDETLPLTKIKRNKLIIQILLSTGVRVSELIHIKKDDINKVERSIRITGKGNKTRIVLYNKETSKQLQEYMDTLPLNQVYLFQNKNGKPLHVKTIQEIVKKQARKSGITRTVTPHMLRHTFATQLLLKGCNIKAIQQLLGHESLETTQVYTQLGLGDVKRAYDEANTR